jgi:hypothetical protein
MYHLKSILAISGSSKNGWQFVWRYLNGFEMVNEN